MKVSNLMVSKEILQACLLFGAWEWSETDNHASKIHSVIQPLWSTDMI